MADPSTCIANLLLRKYRDHDHGVDQIADEVLRLSDKFGKECDEKGVYCHLKHQEEALSLIFTQSGYPPSLTRRKPECLLRPAVADGTGIAFAYNNRFDCCFVKNFNLHSFIDDRILSMKPLVDVALHFILNGHKMEIYLPEYYRNPICSNSGEERVKVDNIHCFKTLVEEGLIKFINPTVDPGGKPTTFPEAVKNIVKQKGGCYISHSSVSLEYNKRYPKLKTRNPTLKTEEEKRNIVTKFYDNVEERMVTANFYTRTKTLTILPQFNFFLKVSNMNVHERKEFYDCIPEERVLYYTKNPGEPEEQIILEEQLKFVAQVKQVLLLCEFYPLDRSTLRSVQLILRFARRQAIFCHYEINTFIDKHRHII